MDALDFEQVARELLVALRGRRSQVAWSRRLGYRSNVAYTWEAGRRWPNAEETFRIAGRTHIDMASALEEFFGERPAWLDQVTLVSPEGVATFLNALRGGQSVSALARRAGLSRYAVSRWLSGQTQPRLPDFLRVIEAASVRMVDFVTTLVDPERMPSILPIWRKLEARRKGAFEVPWTSAVLRALDLDAYMTLPEHEDGWIAARLGISLEEERRCLESLTLSGQVTRKNKRYRPVQLAVDTRMDADIARHLRAHWTEVAGERIRAGAPGQFSYNVFSVSRTDFERIRELHLAYFRAMRAIVAESEPLDTVAVVNVQLFSLEDMPRPHEG